MRRHWILLFKWCRATEWPSMSSIVSPRARAKRHFSLRSLHHPPSPLEWGYPVVIIIEWHSATRGIVEWMAVWSSSSSTRRASLDSCNCVLSRTRRKRPPRGRLVHLRWAGVISCHVYGSLYCVNNVSITNFITTFFNPQLEINPHVRDDDESAFHQLKIVPKHWVFIHWVIRLNSGNSWTGSGIYRTFFISDTIVRGTLSGNVNTLHLRPFFFRLQGEP